MALKSSDRHSTARGSVLDRLIDDEDAPRAHAMAVGQLRNAIRRDLEALLNTRRRCLSLPGDLTELAESVFTYGLPDLLAMDLAAEADREALMHTVGELIAKSDPRFRDVRTELLKNKDELDHTLRFRIEAVVQLAPSIEQIVFDSVVDPASKSITIRTG